MRMIIIGVKSTEGRFIMNLQTTAGVTGSQAMDGQHKSVWSQQLSAPSRAATLSTSAQTIGTLLACIATEQRSDLQTGSTDDCLAAFVNSRMQIADRLLDHADPGAAARCLAQTHQTLLAVLYQTPRTSPWHQSAQWQCRRTHCVLLDYFAEYGCNAAIDEAFRSGCLTMSIPSPALH
jgi:hypothetical protein